MKKINTNKLVALLAALCLMTSAFVGGTLAKYITESTATDSAKVAKWAFEVDDTALTNEFKFDLFNTVKDTDGGETETHISASDGSIIAPGTKGSVSVKLENLSEVDATYAVNFTADNAGVPLQYSVDGNDWKDDIAELDIDATGIAKTNGTATITLHWRWIFNGNDTTDTNLGNAETLAEPKVTAVVTVEQVD